MISVSSKQVRKSLCHKHMDALLDNDGISYFDYVYVLLQYPVTPDAHSPAKTLVKTN